MSISEEMERRLEGFRADFEALKRDPSSILGQTPIFEIASIYRY